MLSTLRAVGVVRITTKGPFHLGCKVLHWCLRIRTQSPGLHLWGFGVKFRPDILMGELEPPGSIQEIIVIQKGNQLSL